MRQSVSDPRPVRAQPTLHTQPVPATHLVVKLFKLDLVLGDDAIRLAAPLALERVPAFAPRAAAAAPAPRAPHAATRAAVGRGLR